jgi:hypothetical protein
MLVKSLATVAVMLALEALAIVPAVFAPVAPPLAVRVMLLAGVLT